MEKQKEVLIRSLPTLKSWILFIPIALAIAFFSYMTRTLCTGKWWFVNGWFIPPTFIFLGLEYLGRRYPKFRLNAAQACLLMIPMYWFGGCFWIAGHFGECNQTDTLSLTFQTFTWVAMHSPSTRSYFQVMNFPSWFIPRDLQAIEIVWRGLMPGETINWFIGPVITWSIILISLMMYDLLTVFLFYGPYWKDVEMLPYPMVTPSTYLVNTYTDRNELGHTRLLNFKDPRIKSFWISAIIGFLVVLPIYVITLFAPFITIYGFGIGTYWFDFNSITRNILPGADFSGMINFGIALALVLSSYDVLITAILFSIVFSWILPVIGFKAGWWPYTPGVETSVEWNIGFLEPFPFKIMFVVGFPIGLAIYWLWSMRDRLKRAFSSLIRKDVIYEHDVPMRPGIIAWVTFAVVLLAMFVVLGMNPIIAIVWLIFWTLYNMASAKVWGLYTAWGIEWSGPVWSYPWQLGPALGQWSYIAPQTPNPSLASYALFSGNFMQHTNCGVAPPIIGCTYSFAHDTHSSIMDIIKFAFVFLLIVTPLMLLFDVWLSHHMGFSNLNEATQSAIPFGFADNVLSRGITSASAYGGASWSTWTTWTVIGVVVAIILELLRLKFVWFFINPLMLAASMTYVIWNAWIALAVKFILSRIFGRVRTREYMVPIISGFLIGTGFFYITAGIHAWVTAGIPNILQNWR